MLNNTQNLKGTPSYRYKVKLWKLKGNAYEKLQYLLSLGWVKFHYIYKTGPTQGTLRYATGTTKYIPAKSIPNGTGSSVDSTLYTTYFDSGRNEWRCAFNNYITFIGAELTRETKLFDKEHRFELKN